MFFIKTKLFFVRIAEPFVEYIEPKNDSIASPASAIAPPIRLSPVRILPLKRFKTPIKTAAGEDTAKEINTAHTDMTKLQSTAASEITMANNAIITGNHTGDPKIIKRVFI